MSLEKRSRACVVALAGAAGSGAALRGAARRAGLRVVVSRDADAALHCMLAEDPLLVVLDDRGSTDGEAAAVLRRLLGSIGRGSDLVVWGGTGRASPRCRRQLKRRLRRGRLAHERALRAQAADPAWQALLAEYRADLQCRMAELASAVRRADAAVALALVHDVKGSAGAYGLGELTPLAAAAQDAFVAGDPRTAFACCERLEALAAGLVRAQR